MAKPSLTEAYDRIKDYITVNGEKLSLVPHLKLYPGAEGEPPEGVASAGIYTPSKSKSLAFFMLDPKISERIITTYKGEGVSALADGMTMTERGVIQKPVPVLGHLGLKKNIARITHDNKSNIIIVVNDDSGARYADGLLKSLLKN
jgi:hypothetical protein